MVIAVCVGFLVSGHFLQKKCRIFFGISMKLHGKAALTPKQRQRVKDLYATGNYSQQELAQQFATTRKTIRTWIHRAFQQNR